MFLTTLRSHPVLTQQRYLEHEELTNFPNANITLLRPSMSFMLMTSPKPIELKSALPDFSKTTHIFLPVNDNTDLTHAEGGSHWSLLLVSVIDGVAFHYDSLSSANAREAHVVAQKLEQLLGKRLRFCDMRECPQQENGSDCGVFVCLLMKHLLINRLLKVDAKNKVSMALGGRDVNAVQGRKEMLKVIEAFRKEGNRRRS